MPVHVPTAVTSLTCTTLAELHASDAVGGVNVGVAGQSIVPFGPADPITGGVISLTVMV